MFGRNCRRRVDAQDYSDAQVIVRVTVFEKNWWQRIASRRGVTLSDLVRKAVMEEAKRSDAVDPRRSNAQRDPVGRRRR